ncbi:hypothetical protein J6590_017028 [Homalodisca vitripennis]|nr:hypothetical protein J6590_017028 [Homalodisca vitripennis]
MRRGGSPVYPVSLTARPAAAGTVVRGVFSILVNRCAAAPTQPAPALSLVVNLCCFSLIDSRGPRQTPSQAVINSGSYSLPRLPLIRCDVTDLTGLHPLITGSVITNYLLLPILNLFSS